MIDTLALPKAELHLHIEGTFEPELIFAIGARNRVAVPYANVDELRHAYNFTDLQSFLNLYYAGMNVLREERDYYDLTSAYLRRAAAQGVRHAEIFFDPQAHTDRGVVLPVVVGGIAQALADGERDLGITSHMIACFLRDLSAESAMATLESMIALGNPRIVAVGLDSAEMGNPPSKFTAVYDRARAEGLLAVAHAGEEGPPAYIWEALDLLKVARVDHGVRCLEDAALVERLRRQKTPLTVCPLSNVRLKVVRNLAEHPLKKMLDAGLLATVNSDDPAYFGGYVGDNFAASASALQLSDAELVTLAKNSFQASFISDAAKASFLQSIDAAVSAE